MGTTAPKKVDRKMARLSRDTGSMAVVGRDGGGWVRLILSKVCYRVKFIVSNVLPVSEVDTATLYSLSC